MKKNLLLIACSITGFAGLTLVLNDFYLVLLSDLIIVSLYALSFNLLFGTGGMVSFGHAIFFGLGAYIPALIITKLEWSFALAVFVSPAITALIAISLSFIVVRVSSFYFSMLTLAIAQIFYTTVIGWYDFTNGDQGIQGILHPDKTLNIRDTYLVILIVAVICVGLIRGIEQSTFGLTAKSIRDNPRRSPYLGFRSGIVKQLLFVISGFFASVAGTLSAFQQNAAHPSMLSFEKSISAVLAALLGGAHQFFGPVFGTFIYRALEELTSKISSEHWPLVVGVLMIALTVYWPRGFVGMLQDPRWLKWAWRSLFEVLRRLYDFYWWLQLRRKQ